MSFKEYNANSDLIDGKALETLIIASVRILKRGNKKCVTGNVSKLVNRFLCRERTISLIVPQKDTLNNQA